MRKASLFLAMLLLISCQDGRSQPRTDGRKNANLGKFYLVAVTPAEVTVDARSSVVVAFTPGSGYKWNDEYPTRFNLPENKSFRFDKSDFSGRKKEIEISKEAARLTIPLVVTKPGPHKLDIKGSFSVCNKTSCKIFRNETVSVTITGSGSEEMEK